MVIGFQDLFLKQAQLTEVKRMVARWRVTTRRSIVTQLSLALAYLLLPFLNLKLLVNAQVKISEFFRRSVLRMLLVILLTVKLRVFQSIDY